jgi:hAT family C-terminal dimerisation region
VHKNVEKGKTEDLENDRASNSLGEFTACYSSDDDSASPTTSSNIAKEIDEYCQCIGQPLFNKGEEKYKCPLKWWEAHATRFPYDWQMANMVLHITATSAPSEHVFSTVAQGISKKHA